MMDRQKNQRTDLFGQRTHDSERRDVRQDAGVDSVEVPAHPQVDGGFTSIKTLVIFAVIFGCFAVIYPRFIHPVVKHAYYGQSLQDKIPEEKFLPPKFQQGAINPDLRNRPIPRSNMQDRPTHHPGSRFTGDYGHVPESKGSLYIMLPLFTAGIIGFLLYTFYKVLSNNNNNPRFIRSVQQKNLGYSPAQRHFSDTNPMEREINRIDSLLSQQQEKNDPRESDAKITEFQLKALEAKLKETEAQMNQLIAQMAVVKSVDEIVKKAELAVQSDDLEEAEEEGEEEEEEDSMEDDLQSDRISTESLAAEETELLIDQEIREQQLRSVEVNWDSDIQVEDQELPLELLQNNENDDPDFDAFSFLTTKPT